MEVQTDQDYYNSMMSVGVSHLLVEDSNSEDRINTTRVNTETCLMVTHTLFVDTE